MGQLGERSSKVMRGQASYRRHIVELSPVTISLLPLGDTFHDLSRWPFYGESNFVSTVDNYETEGKRGKLWHLYANLCAVGPNGNYTLGPSR